MHSPNSSTLSSSSAIPSPLPSSSSSSSSSFFSSSSSDSIKVCVRVRPLNEKERLKNSQSVWRTTNNTTIYSVSSQVNSNNNNNSNGNSSNNNNNIGSSSGGNLGINSNMMIPMVPSSSDVSYTFDHVYDQNSTTDCIYNDMCKHIVTSSVRGYNGTIFAYGQTSSGKTFTMKGTREIHGIIPLSIKDVFTTISQTQSRRFQIRVSYLEIYNEVIKDLLDPENQNLKIREDFVNGKGVYVSGAKEEEVACMEDMLKLMEKGEHYRHFGNTAMNDQSSRSHTIFRIMIESIDGSIAKQMVEEEDFDIYTTNSEVLFSTLNLVDLAGSERVLYTQAQGDRLREGGHINKSLLTLGNVIAKLSEGNSSHIPYRDSKLTRILSNSLGGNSKTAIICTITPASQHFEETHSTLKFANRAKSINNQITINKMK
ncbi:kinesin-7 [Naegleria gruberi]|uniref:Kinesin-like protein n=1 Tax=Naegleria gruberi TaxID=5762 RepID=D2VLI2_NAEGR|nr:kinesin-7 [Naegleria gruberi]EFC42316.1 kinesin-7 [Naegleria gruberi]|eukprot:XP_002675060.1 kinesin-7 [Naegleria gruberi]